MSIFTGNHNRRRTPRGAPPQQSQLKRLGLANLTLTMLALCLSVVGIGIGQALPPALADGTLPTPTNFRFTSADYYTPRGASMPPNSGVNVNMAWEQSGNYSYFLMQRSSDGGTTWQSYSPLYGEMFSPYIYDDSLAPTTLFCYRVMATYQAGGPGDASSAYTNPICTVGLVYPPTPTLDVPTYNAATSSAQLSWSDSGAGVSVPQGWIIQRSTATTGWTTLTTLTDGNLHSYTDSTATPGTIWYYRLLATNQGGSSGYSVAQHAGGLAVPAGLTVTANQSPNVSLSWQGSVGAANYHVERSTPTSGWQEIGQIGGTATSYTDTSAPGGTLYYYRVWASATNGLANSDYSGVVNTHAIPATPQSLTAQPLAATQVSLSWSASGYTGQGFVVERKLGAGGTYSQIGQVTATATTFTDNSPAASNLYYYRLRSFDSLGYSQYSQEVAALTFPGAPSGLAAQSLGSQANPAQQINLSWQPSSPAGNTTIRGYKIQRKGPGDTAYTRIAMVDANTTAFNDTSANGLTANTVYSYRVKAYNSAGDSLFTNEVAATTAPNPPTSLSVTSVGDSQVALAWIANNPGAGGGNNGVSAFAIEQQVQAPTGTGNRTGGNSWVEVGRVNGSATSYTVTNLKNGTTYLFRVRAVNSAQLYSAYTTLNSPVTTTLPAPTSLVVTPRSLIELDLSWQDASNSATAIRIERRLGATGGANSNPYSLVAVVNLAQPGATGSYRDVGLVPGQTYSYRVQATTAYTQSAYSQEVAGTTPSSADLVVTAPTDDGSGRGVGTLSWALSQAHSGQSISFNLPVAASNTVRLMGGPALTVPAGVTLAGSCSYPSSGGSLPGVSITGGPLKALAPLAKLGLAGQDTLFGLRLSNLKFTSTQDSLTKCSLY